MSKWVLNDVRISVTKVMALFLAVFVVFISLCPALVSGSEIKQTGAAAGELSPKKNITEWEGSESELRKPFAGIVENEKDWSALWKRAFKTKAPAVNFKKHAVACVFLGHYPGWWYHLGFDEPEISGSTMTIRYSLVDLRVELMDGGKRGLVKEYGARGQYKMRLVEKKHGFSIRIEQDGKPQVPLKQGFGELLEKQTTGVPNAD